MHMSVCMSEFLYLLLICAIIILVLPKTSIMGIFLQKTCYPIPLKAIYILITETKPVHPLIRKQHIKTTYHKNLTSTLIPQNKYIKTTKT